MTSSSLLSTPRQSILPDNTLIYTEYFISYIKRKNTSYDKANEGTLNLFDVWDNIVSSFNLK